MREHTLSMFPFIIPIEQRTDGRTEKMKRTEVIELLKEPLTIKEISERTGYSVQGVYSIARKEGLQTRRGIPIAEMTMLYRETHTVQETAKHFGITEEGVRERIRRVKEKKHPCLVCGQVTDRPKYCSDECNKKARNVRSRAYRRAREIKLTVAMINPEITLDELFKRDKGVCHICGAVCDKEDYKWIKRGIKVCGGNYPSIDHVKPLSKGGQHSWDNVRLAHMVCNATKGANYEAR